MVVSYWKVYNVNQVNFIQKKEEGKVKEEHQLECNKITIEEKGGLKTT